MSCVGPWEQNFLIIENYVPNRTPTHSFFYLKDTRDPPPNSFMGYRLEVGGAWVEE